MTSDDGADAALARRAAEGDDGAFTELVGRHKDPLYRLLRRYSGSSDEAYEAVQETFIAAWAALGRYDPARPFGPWLRTIALNKARDRARRGRLRSLVFGARPLDAEGANQVADQTQLADEALMAVQQTQRLDGAVAVLPDRLKAPLLLTAFEGYSQIDAGRLLGVSAKTVETRVSRARKKLAAALAGDQV